MAPAPPLTRPDVSQIRAVAFDCYGTLLDFEERSFGPALQEFLTQRGVAHVDGESVWKHWLDASREHSRAHGRDPEGSLDGPEPAFYRMAQTWPRFFEHAFSKAAIESIAPVEAFQHLFDLLAEADAYPEVQDVLTGLRERDVTVVVASNADDVHLRPALERRGITSDYVISSEEVRSYKPRRPFFDAITERLELAPSQIIYVGDSPYADVTGATHAGMLSYWVRRYDDERRDQLLKTEPSWTFPDLRGLLAILAGENHA